MLRAFQKWVYDLSSTIGGHLSRQMGTIDMEHTLGYVDERMYWKRVWFVFLWPFLHIRTICITCQ